MQGVDDDDDDDASDFDGNGFFGIDNVLRGGESTWSYRGASGDKPPRTTSGDIQAVCGLYQRERSHRQGTFLLVCGGGSQACCFPSNCFLVQWR